ncbi:hypothetical protein IPJ91_01850 [bacterium]|nr:MAG: hypothetical protein IPJ91_01850 [bacterium]
MANEILAGGGRNELGDITVDPNRIPTSYELYASIEAYIGKNKARFRIMGLEFLYKNSSKYGLTKKFIERLIKSENITYKGIVKEIFVVDGQEQAIKNFYILFQYKGDKTKGIKQVRVFIGRAQFIEFLTDRYFDYRCEKLNLRG